MTKTNRTKVPRYYWFRPGIAKVLREYTERERRNENEQVEIFIEEALQKRGVITEGKLVADPQPRTRRVGRVRKAAASMVLAALVAGSPSPVRADSRVSTFSQPGLHILSTWWRRRYADAA